MQKLLLAVTIASASVLGTSHSVRAQATDQPTYVVAYFEVAPKAVAEARGLLTTHCNDARKASGLIEIDALQRLGRANHFAILEKWQSAKAREDYAATDTAKSFAAGLGPAAHGRHIGGGSVRFAGGVDACRPGPDVQGARRRQGEGIRGSEPWSRR
jgi:quinol monooxygenase YgiN